MSDTPISGPQDALPPPARASSPWSAPGSPARTVSYAPADPEWLKAVRPGPLAPMGLGTLVSVLVTGVLTALLMGEGVGANLLLVAVPAAAAAYFAARGAGRRPRVWTVLWACGGVGLLVVPLLRAALWPVTLAMFAALAAGTCALVGGRGWHAVLLGPTGLFAAAPASVGWLVEGVKRRAAVNRRRWVFVLRTGGIAVGLLVVFGALFASADAAFADLLGSLAPDMTVGDSPWRFFLFLLGALGALAAARTAAAPLRWDRIPAGQGKARGRLEWALPLAVLNVLFAVFIGVQLVVLFGGYDTVLRETGLTYAEYARQGFWQLLWVTLLVLVVVALALRWAPRSGHRDRVLVRGVLGTLCVLTLVVVVSALRRMDLYVEAYGLTRLRISVFSVEVWLGLVIVMIMAAGVFGARWLPRAVAGSAAAAVLAFGLVNPDAMIAERNTHLADRGIDTDYLSQLSADAVPVLDRLDEPYRSCALIDIADDLEEDGAAPWYAISLSEARARDILESRPVDRTVTCGGYSGRGSDW
ncbi:hypothetical protein SRB5_55280 [Streptomyces sp. RB5]|uniref:DUF4173 domain-containing protein n=1 Tax=Streptomyces smaragdinus TaxID=2585196 RepID=A0A7K0CPH9_9ACTN|nr:DUF4173 domain-containing protein [Streptomyces smaragdinus]MQY15349.1 hypothetical protein [Streptomyces smaragdinus]